MKTASIIGFGNVCEGDFCVGSCVIEALEQEQLGDAIQLAYVGHDPRAADLWLYDIDFAVIVGAVSMGGSAGHICCWDLKTFQRNLPWFAFTSPSVESLAKALTRARIAGGFPEDLLFLWIEPKVMNGLSISKEARKALRAAVRIIKLNLSERGLLCDALPKTVPIYRLEILRTVA